MQDMERPFGSSGFLSADRVFKKVVPFLLVGAEYGHLLTLWRLLYALGFYVSFTAPIYSSYSTQICRKGECIRSWAMNAWGACSHRKMIAGLALSAFWNLTTVRTHVLQHSYASP